MLVDIAPCYVKKLCKLFCYSVFFHIELQKKKWWNWGGLRCNIGTFLFFSKSVFADFFFLQQKSLRIYILSLTFATLAGELPHCR